MHEAVVPDFHESHGQHVHQVASHELVGAEGAGLFDAALAVTVVEAHGVRAQKFDTLFAEGQRRYIESFSAFARQFLDRMDRPQIRSLHNIPPAIAIQQTSKVRSARSTVGTMTEINDYLKILYARSATPHCPSCGAVAREDNPEAAAQALLASSRGRRAIICFRYDSEQSGRTSATFPIYLNSKVQIAGPVYP